MFISEETLDDLLHAVFRRILHKGKQIKPSKGPNRELIGVLLELRKPAARLSQTETKGTVFSCLGETLWYLAKTDKLDFIAYYLRSYKKYSDDGLTTFGAYGPRLFRMRGKTDQVENIIQLLKRKPSTRQAVIQLFNAEDIVDEHRDVPCTCSLQFFVRDGRLHLLANMRSNDAFIGLPHDVFAFTFLQELVARSVGAELGKYMHAVGSLHLYDIDLEKAKQFLREDFQPTISMPAMPPGDPWPSIAHILKTEVAIRRRKTVPEPEFTLANYWADLVRLLQIYAHTGKKAKINRIKGQMVSSVYNAYIDKRSEMSVPKRKAF